ncbi:MAG: hypothetical protein K6G45_00885 [Lachnospiraceae bacterium]|nr:hypothetical protein [Lachnospiraceae bacterium]
MILYHMSQTLSLGDSLVCDNQKCMRLSEPFIQGLEQSEDCFIGMVLNAKYMFAVLSRSGLREWSDYAKWATEGAFEYVRRNSYPEAVSRLNCNYFYSDLEDSRKLYEYDWGEASEEEQALVHLFEVEVDDSQPDKRDMSLYDEAYDAMSEKQDIKTVLRCAEEYYAGHQSKDPVWEILSDKKAVAVKDITDILSKTKS